MCAAPYMRIHGRHEMKHHTFRKRFTTALDAEANSSPSSLSIEAGLAMMLTASVPYGEHASSQRRREATPFLLNC